MSIRRKWGKQRVEAAYRFGHSITFGKDSLLRHEAGDLVSKLWGEVSSARVHTKDAAEVGLFDARVVDHLMHHGRDKGQKGDLVSSRSPCVLA